MYSQNFSVGYDICSSAVFSTHERRKGKLHPYSIKTGIVHSCARIVIKT